MTYVGFAAGPALFVAPGHINVGRRRDDNDDGNGVLSHIHLRRSEACLWMDGWVAAVVVVGAVVDVD